MQYRTGLVSVTNGSTTVTGDVSVWSINVTAGDKFKVANSDLSEVLYTISSVESDTSLTLTAPYAGGTQSGVSYVIARDRTPDAGYNLIYKGDIETAALISENFTILETLVPNATASATAAADSATAAATSATAAATSAAGAASSATTASTAATTATTEASAASSSATSAASSATSAATSATGAASSATAAAGSATSAASSASDAAALVTDTGVTAGSYTAANITVNAQGRITAASDGGAGTVTSVAMSVPTGLSVSGTPITTSGTLALTYASGYQGYTTTEATKLSGIATGATANTGTVTSVTVNTSGTGLSGSGTITTSGTVTITSNATSANTASAIVARDGSGNFSAGTITATLNGNASTVGGYSVSESATGSTVVARTSAGYLYATYLNQSSGQSEDPTIGQVFVENSGADGFLRKSSIAHLTASLSGTAPISISGNAATATSATSATTSTYSTYLWSTSHPGSYYISNAWDGTYWFITSNHGSPVRVGYADSAGSASSASTATTATTASTANALATGNNYQMNSLGVNTAASGTAGEIRATNNVTAYYSDLRLKDVEGPITDPIAKVQALTGFYFRANETAQALGYTDERQVGVGAQDVEAVLPEIIKPAPIDPQYKTLDYAKLVPLLIEAVKEQQQQINLLKSDVAAMRGV